MQQYNYHQRPQIPVSTGDWIITLIISGIPFLGFIMLLVWAFDKSTPISKANYAKAALILWAIGIAFVILFVGIIGLSTFPLLFPQYS
ncbi:hypothetical protein KZP23_09830 [Echinicola marina]|uniref:hypothetical protein n=1 Tax=Echinicola marina TaxID=2859768 RepID=UPI001CF70DC2|nr:hypothetical protein [Echinicola marina]UCS95278.1 hypothetical protein KZP23_09830 [Echinicola marina]